MCVEPPAEPEAAQRSGQVCGDIVVRVVYSTVASTQWSKRQIRDIIQMVQYSYSTTSIHQLYIVRCFFLFDFFFFFFLLCNIFQGVRVFLDLVTITSLLLDGMGGWLGAGGGWGGQLAEPSTDGTVLGDWK